MFVAASNLDGHREELTGALLASYLLVPPVIHALHARVGMSFASLAIRVGLPIGGMAMGEASVDCSGEDSGTYCGLSEAVVGFGLGALSAMVIDSALFAWESPPERQRNAARIKISPALAPARGGASAGVLGVF
jgi:hypothetical protein